MPVPSNSWQAEFLGYLQRIGARDGGWAQRLRARLVELNTQDRYGDVEAIGIISSIDRGGPGVKRHEIIFSDSTREKSDNVRIGRQNG